MSSSTTDSECFICYEKYNYKIDKNKVIECETCHKRCCFKCFLKMSNTSIYKMETEKETKSIKHINYHKAETTISCNCTICKNPIGVKVECLSKPQLVYYNKFITYKLYNLVKEIQEKDYKIQMIIEENRKLGECLINKLDCTSVKIQSV